MKQRERRYGIITLEMGDLVFQLLWCSSMGHCCLDQKILGFYNFLGIVSFVINSFLTWFLKPSLVHELNANDSIMY